MKRLIKINGVNAAYSGKVALSNVNIDISEGESVAILGPNGSGKSTLLKLISGIVSPTVGTYFFDDIKIDHKTHKDQMFMKSFYKRVGFLFQNPENQLFCSTVAEELAFGPRQMGMKEVDVTNRVDDCLNLLEIKHLRDRIPYNLSDGEKKKVALSAVLSLNPEVLVLDEPMNGLDPRTKRFMKDFLIKMNRTVKKTIISATHDYEYVKGLFNRAIVLSETCEIIRDDNFESVISDDEFLLNNNLK